MLFKVLYVLRFTRYLSNSLNYLSPTPSWCVQWALLHRRSSHHNLHLFSHISTGLIRLASLMPPSSGPCLETWLMFRATNVAWPQLAHMPHRPTCHKLRNPNGYVFFATLHKHGLSYLTPIQINEICLNFQKGYCFWGPRCHRIHERVVDDRRGAETVCDTLYFVP